MNTQKSIIKEFLFGGFSVNFQPHIDPIKYAMPYDVLGLNDYPEGWYNAGATQALEEYWNTH